MKSILHTLLSSLGRSFSKAVATSSKNSLSASSYLLEKSGNHIFLVSYLSTFMNSIFGFIQKNTASVYGQMKLSQSHRFKVNALGVLTLVLFFGANEIKGQTNPSLFDMSTGSSYTFASWASTSTAGTYPSNMYIWQHAIADPTLSTSFTGNYSIAYSFTSKTRCSGQGTNGLSFVNTGSTNTGGGQVGAAVVGLNTTSRNTIIVAWTGRTIGASVFSGTQDRATSIRLQYKVGSGGTWTDVSSSTEYSSLATSSSYKAIGNSQNFSQTLPAACEGQSSVYVRWVYFTASGTIGSRPELGIDDITVSSSTAASTPTISTSGTLSAVNTTYGTASSNTSFSVSGANMSAGITVKPPAGYEVSTSSTFTSGIGTNASPITVGAAGTIASTPVYVRLSSTATVAGSPYSGNIVLSSASATSVNVATVSSTVTAKALTISVAANNKPYDGTTTAALETPAYVGLVNGESFSVTGTAIANFADVNVGTAKTVTISGYTAPSTNYTLTAQPSATANITAANLTITGVTADNKVYDGTTTASLVTTSAAYSGLVSGDTFIVQG
ncbi:MAG: YDG domain-containing protein, partial [Flavobacterium sp.]|uniref:YDG domain-containing protein n=1 Tax=Flavobacterium sp. TaxID=239 RepID=UPI003BC0F69D